MNLQRAMLTPRHLSQTHCIVQGHRCIHHISPMTTPRHPVAAVHARISALRSVSNRNYIWCVYVCDRFGYYRYLLAFFIYNKINFSKAEIIFMSLVLILCLPTMNIDRHMAKIASDWWAGRPSESDKNRFTNAPTRSVETCAELINPFKMLIEL